MPSKRHATIAQYIAAAPQEGRSHLRRLHKILKDAAPHAEAVIKWNAPMFIDPRYVYAWAAFKAHCVFSPSPEALKAFKTELKEYETTKYYLKLPYDEPLPAALLKKIAKWRVRNIGDHSSFW